MRPDLDLALSPSEPEIGMLTERLRELFACHALPDGYWERFALSFDEVVSNIAAYGAPHGPIRVRVRVASDEVRASVIDDGIAFNPLLRPDPDTTGDIDARPIGGLGIFLLKKMMDRVTYRRYRHCNCLSFAKRIGPSPAPRAGDAPTLSPTSGNDCGNQ